MYFWKYYEWFVKNSEITYLYAGEFQIYISMLDIFHELQAYFFLRRHFYWHFQMYTHKKERKKNTPPLIFKLSTWQSHMDVEKENQTYCLKQSSWFLFQLQNHPALESSSFCNLYEWYYPIFLAWNLGIIRDPSFSLLLQVQSVNKSHIFSPSSPAHSAA